MIQWISEEEEYDIRYSTLEDLPALKDWLAKKDVMRWYPLSSLEDVEPMAKNWVGFSRFKASLTAVYQKEVVGIATLFLMPYRKLVHHSMLYFIVSPSYAKRGIGSSLIRNINHLAKNYFHFEKVHVEIYEHCAAISILEKAGYREIMRQEKFVKEAKDRYLARIILEIDLQADLSKEI